MLTLYPRSLPCENNEIIAQRNKQQCQRLVENIRNLWNHGSTNPIAEVQKSSLSFHSTHEGQSALVSGGTWPDLVCRLLVNDLEVLSLRGISKILCSLMLVFLNLLDRC